MTRVPRVDFARRFLKTFVDAKGALYKLTHLILAAIAVGFGLAVSCDQALTQNAVKGSPDHIRAVTSAVESAVAAAVAPDGGPLVLQVPHHGSRTSSGEEFIAALQPSLALVSAGYRNHFNHPHPAIVARYAAAGSGLLNTSQSGFVDIRFGPDSPPRVVEQGRVDRHPYWRE